MSLAPHPPLTDSASVFPDSAFLTLDEVARLLRVSERTVRRWALAGRIATQRLPGSRGKILVPASALRDLVGAGVQ